MIVAALHFSRIKIFYERGLVCLRELDAVKTYAKLPICVRSQRVELAGGGQEVRVSQSASHLLHEDLETDVKDAFK